MYGGLLIMTSKEFSPKQESQSAHINEKFFILNAFLLRLATFKASKERSDP